jgi:hypothetical protein
VLKVHTKAVSNVLGDMRPYGAWISRPNGDKQLEYSIAEAGVLAYQLKKDAPAVKYVTTSADTPKPRRKIRSPLVRAIDDEIKALETKIKDLQRVRKDYE